MKLIIPFVLLLTAHSQAWWWSDDDKKQRIRELEQQITVERQNTEHWQITAGILAVSAVLSFTAGTALGAKAKRDGKA